MHMLQTDSSDNKQYKNDSSLFARIICYVINYSITMVLEMQ